MNDRRITGRLWLTVIACLAGAGALALPSQSRAQASYPTHPIKVIVPFTAGGSSDLSARRVSEGMSRILGQPLIMENKPSAGGIVGVNDVAQAAPDGYTLLAGTISTHALNVGLYKNLSYDPLKDFTPITRIGSFPNVLVVNSALNISTLADLIKLAKERDKQGKPLSYASGGNGSTSHLGGVLLGQVAGVELLHIPYKGAAGAMPDLLSGRVDMLFANIQLIQQHLASGTLKALAVTTSTRSNLLPDVPTVAELGFKNAEMSVWIALFAPKNIPAAMAQKLNAAAIQAMKSPAVVEGFAKEGVIAEYDESPAAFRTFLAAEVDKWSKVVRASGATAD
ncbi:tripartite tricarboxylate transporter substrate binding protein [soil metagenome]